MSQYIADNIRRNMGLSLDLHGNEFAVEVKDHEEGSGASWGVIQYFPTKADAQAFSAMMRSRQDEESLMVFRVQRYPMGGE